MTARLPTNGSDNGTWGTLLNEYLSVQHNADGTHPSGVDSTAIHDNVANEISAVTEKTTVHNNDLILIEDSENSNTKKSVKRSNLIAGTVSWEQTVNETGSSFANFTSGGGTWSSDGTVIKQTDTAATWRTAKLTSPVDIGSGIIFEADVKMVSGGGSLRMLGLILGYSGSNSSQGTAADLRVSSGTKEIHWVKGFTLDTLVSAENWGAEDAFIKLRLVSTGPLLSIYLNGVFKGTSGNTHNSADARYIGLISYGCEAHFKNIKTWKLQYPA